MYVLYYTLDKRRWTPLFGLRVVVVIRLESSKNIYLHPSGMTLRGDLALPVVSIVLS